MMRRREVSSREVVSAFLARIDTLNPSFNAIVSRRPDGDVLAEADEADRALLAGDDLGPLHGLPHAIKDTANTAGLRSTYGSPLFADHVPNEDGLAVGRVRRAGAIVIGKTNVPEFGLGSHTYNPIFGATGNAWNPAFSAGGSSGGAAVAVAQRMLPMADGSDLGGSLRNPGGWNNVFGLRPSQGRVPSWPRSDAFFAQLVTEGPIARNAADLALAAQRAERRARPGPTVAVERARGDPTSRRRSSRPPRRLARRSPRALADGAGRARHVRDRLEAPRRRRTHRRRADASVRLGAAVALVRRPPPVRLGR